MVPGQSTALDSFSPETLKVKYLKEAQRSRFVGPATGTDVCRSLRWQPFSLERCIYNKPLQLKSAVFQLLLVKHWQPINKYQCKNVHFFQVTGSLFFIFLNCRPGWYEYCLSDGSWMNVTALQRQSWHAVVLKCCLLPAALSSTYWCARSREWGAGCVCVCVCVCVGVGVLSLEATCPNPVIWNRDQSSGPFNCSLAGVLDLSFVVLTADWTLWALYTR